MADDNADTQEAPEEEQSTEEGATSSKQGRSKSSSRSSGSSSSSSRSKRAPAKKSQSSSSKQSSGGSKRRQSSSKQSDEDAESEESAGEDTQGDEAGDGGTIQPPKQLGGRELVTRAKSHVHELTGRRPESVSGLERWGDGWRVTFEFLELSRVPPTTDVLGTYHLDLTEDGEIAGLQRSRRYLRNQPEGGDGGT